MDYIDSNDDFNDDGVDGNASEYHSESDYTNNDFQADFGNDGGEPDFEESRSFSNNMPDYNTFKVRNDPESLIERVRLNLMNAWIETVETVDTDGRKSYKRKLRFKKNTQPKANKQGIADIVGYIERFINNHTVQGNIVNNEEFNRKMLSISTDIVIHFTQHRKNWGINIGDLDEIIGTVTNLIDIFLTRTLYNEERKGYGESYRETTSRDLRPQPKPDIYQRINTGIKGMFGGSR